MDNKTLLNKVSEGADIEVETCVTLQDALNELIVDALARGETVSVPSFGNFEPRKRNERVMVHPAVKGKRLLVPPKIVASFKPSTILKNKINERGDE